MIVYFYLLSFITIMNSESAPSHWRAWHGGLHVGSSWDSLAMLMYKETNPVLCDVIVDPYIYHLPVCCAVLLEIRVLKVALLEIGKEEAWHGSQLGTGCTYELLYWSYNHLTFIFLFCIWIALDNVICGKLLPNTGLMYCAELIRALWLPRMCA